MKILVTGASGFVGRALLEHFSADAECEVTAAVRRSVTSCIPKVSYTNVGDLGPETSWVDAVRGQDVVVHAAARVHIMRESALDPIGEFRRANVDGTLRLARQAAAAGVRRFVFISSIKVNGEFTSPTAPFGADDVPSPADPYGISKLEAELGLRESLRGTATRLVVIRPALVYGPAVRANFLTMMRWVRRGIPLPLGGIRNRRSLVALDNLVDLIALCCVHPKASDQIFLAADRESLSTTEILNRIGVAMERPARLFRVPTGLLRSAASLIGKREVARRLLDSLVVDISKARDLMGWVPPIDVDEGLRRAVRHYLDGQRL